MDNYRHKSATPFLSMEESKDAVKFYIRSVCGNVPRPRTFGQPTSKNIQKWMNILQNSVQGLVVPGDEERRDLARWAALLDIESVLREQESVQSHPSTVPPPKKKKTHSTSYTPYFNSQTSDASLGRQSQILQNEVPNSGSAMPMYLHSRPSTSSTSSHDTSPNRISPSCNSPNHNFLKRNYPNRNFPNTNSSNRDSPNRISASRGSPNSSSSRLSSPYVSSPSHSSRSKEAQSPSSSTCVGNEQEEKDDTFFRPREYQTLVLNRAKMPEKNIICYSETGSGKTFIAVKLLQHEMDKQRELLARHNSALGTKMEIDEMKHDNGPPHVTVDGVGGSPMVGNDLHFGAKNETKKCAVFIVNTVALVTQQYSQIERHSDLKVKKYVGEMGVDKWKKLHWQEEFQSNEVLVMTAQILLDILLRGFWRMSDISVLVLDECHHTTKGHPFNKIMEVYHRTKSEGDFIPKIFGMTASPIKRKGKRCNLEQDLSSLEKNLDAELVVVARDFRGLEQVVPRPDEEILIFQANWNVPELPASFSNVPITKCSEKIKKEQKKAIEQIKRIHDSCGLWFAMQATKIFSEEYGFESTYAKEARLARMQAIRTSAPNDSDEKGDMFRIAHDHSNDRRKKQRQSFRDYLKMIVPEFECHGPDLNSVSPKVRELVEFLLNKKKDIPNLTAIIFAQERLVARILSFFLNTLPCVKNSGITSDFAVGHAEAGLIRGLTQKKQNEAILKLRTGSINVVVATSLLEEGIDVQPCRLVIRFDMFSTPKSYIQSRGRARHKDSEYVIMVGDDNTEQMMQIAHAKMYDDVMSNTVENGFEREASFETRADSDPYMIAETGAVINLDNSIGVLSMFCSCEQYLPPRYSQIYSSGLACFCVTFEDRAPLQKVVGDGQISKKLAKQHVSKKACIMLHKKGLIDEHLRPPSLRQKALTDKKRKAKKKKEKEHEEELVLCILHTSEVFQGTWKFSLDDRISLNLYRIIIEPDGAEMKVDGEVEFGFLIENKIDEETLQCLRFPIYPKHIGADLNKKRIRAKVSVEYCRNVVLSCEQYKAIRDLHKKMFQCVLSSKPIQTRSDLDCSEPMYLVVPLVVSLELYEIDWSQIDALTKRTELMLLQHLQKSDISNCVLKTAYKNAFYLALEIDYSKTPNSKMPGSDDTYACYLEKKYSLKHIDRGQPLISAYAWRPEADTVLRHPQEEQFSQARRIHLVPSLCEVLPLPGRLIKSMENIPSIMWNLQVLSQLKELHVALKIDHKVRVDWNVLQEAMTCKSADSQRNYERLEFLGDTILKFMVGTSLYLRFPEYQEEQLTDDRTDLISNSNLYKKAMECKFARHIVSRKYQRHHYVPPGFEGKDSTIQHAKLARKNIADVVESLIGACYESFGGNLLQSGKFLTSLGINIDFPGLGKEHNSERSSGGVYLNVEEIQQILKYDFSDITYLKTALTHSSIVNESSFQRLEYLGDGVLDFIIVDYLYHHYPEFGPGDLSLMKSHLVRNDTLAFITTSVNLQRYLRHESQPIQTEINNYFKNQEMHKELVKKVLTELRDHVLGSTPQRLFSDYVKNVMSQKNPTKNEFVKIARNLDRFGEVEKLMTNEDKQNLKDELRKECQESHLKILSDVMESLIGAVFLDCKGDVQKVWDVFRELFRPFLEIQMCIFSDQSEC